MPSASTRHSSRNAASGQKWSSARATADHPHAEHPPEELLEVLVIAGEELSPELYGAITEHARTCKTCCSVLGLLLQFHRAIKEEGSEEGDGGWSSNTDALVRAVFFDE